MFVGEFKDDGFVGDFVVADGVLGNDLIFIFDFHRHAIVGKHGFAFFQNARHFSGFDAMIIILTNPDLELAGLRFTSCSTTIEKGFMHVTDFGDVEGERNGIAFGKTDAEMAFRILGEEGFQFGKFHDRVGSVFQRFGEFDRARAATTLAIGEPGLGFFHVGCVVDYFGKSRDDFSEQRKVGPVDAEVSPLAALLAIEHSGLADDLHVTRNR